MTCETENCKEPAVWRLEGCHFHCYTHAWKIIHNPYFPAGDFDWCGEGPDPFDIDHACLACAHVAESDGALFEHENNVHIFPKLKEKK